MLRVQTRGITVSRFIAVLALAWLGCHSLRGQSTRQEMPLAGAQQEAQSVLERYGKRDIRVHDPSSIVRCGDEYWLFSTGRLVSSWRSTDLKNWERGPRVFEQMPEWVRDVVPDQWGHFWAPDVIEHDGQYWLYYSVSSFGKNTSAIALATNQTLDPDDPEYEWQDQGIVIQTGSRDNFNAIDPAVLKTSKGELWMSLGSYWSGLKLIRLDPKTGKRFEADEKIYSLADHDDIEAAHIHERDGWFYLFLNWGKCCRGVESTYNIRVGRSRQITGPYVDQQGKELLDDGGTLLLQSEGPFIGPGHANVLSTPDGDLFHCHFYDATNRGRSYLATMGLTWNSEGWPEIKLNQPEKPEPQTQARTPLPSEGASSDPPVEWVDPETNHRVVRLSKQAGSASLYFHQNAFTPEGDKLLIATPQGLETVDLATRELNLVVPNRDYRIGGSSGVEMGRVTRRVFYTAREGREWVVKATHVDTGETEEIVRLPRGAAFCSVNADETRLFGKISQRTPPGQPRDMQFFTVDVATGKIKTFHQSSSWLNHLQCSPTNPELGLFCHEGSWHEVDRVWTIRFGEDEPTLMHRREQQYEIAGHEFFGPQGKWVWYDLQTPRAKEFWLAGVELATGKRIRYPLERNQWSVHYNVSADGKLFAGDGGGPESVANQTPLPEKRRLRPAQNGQWIYLFRPIEASDNRQSNADNGFETRRFEAERLVDLSKHDYSLEPNVRFSPDGKWIIFRSNMHGERHVYAVSVEPEKQ